MLEIFGNSASNHYLRTPIWNKTETKMQQNRMHILLTTIGRVQGVKRFEGVLCVPISSVKTADSIGNTIQLRHTRTRIL